MKLAVLSRIAIAFATFALGGCGGGGNRIVSTPPATTTPLAPPGSPTPPIRTGGTHYYAQAVYAEGRLAVATGADGRFAVTGISPPTSVGEPRIALNYIGPDRYMLDWDFVAGFDFEPADRVSSNGPFEVYRQTAPTDNRLRATLEVSKPETLQLTYASLGNFAVAYGPPQSGSVEGAIGFFAAGTPTPPVQMPTSGRARYTGIADGLWIDGATVRRLFGSTAVLEADFGTGNVTSTLNLVGRDDPFGNFASAPTTTLGQFVGTTRIAETTNQSYRFFNNFTGTYAPVAGYSGSFSGVFFGSNAQEVGLNFRLTGPTGQQVFGAAAARQ